MPRIRADSSASLDEIRRRSLEAIRETAALLDARAGERVAPFKSWRGEIACKVAGAGLEDAFPGFDGIRMSEKKKATLAALSAALGLAPPE